MEGSSDRSDKTFSEYMAEWPKGGQPPHKARAYLALHEGNECLGEHRMTPKEIIEYLSVEAG